MISGENKILGISYWQNKQKEHLVFPIDKGHSWSQVDRSRLKLNYISTALNSFTSHLGKVSDLGKVRLGAGDSFERLLQDIQDMVNYKQTSNGQTQCDGELLFLCHDMAEGLCY